MTLLEIILLIVGAGCLIAGYFIPEKPKTKASWEEKKEIKRMHDLIDSDLEKYKENLKKSLEDEMNEYMENAHKGIESISEEKIKELKECGDNAIGDINKNHEDIKDTLKTIESFKDEATADFEKSKSALDEAKDTLKAIENAKDEGKVEIEKSESELVIETEKTETDDPEDDLIKILKEGMDETETGISDITKEKKEPSDDSKKTKTNKKNTKKTVKRSAESISFASKNTDEILRLYKEGKSNVAIAKELGIGVGEVKLVIDLAKM